MNCLNYFARWNFLAVAVLFALATFGLPSSAMGQDTAKSMLQLAGKTAKQARSKKGEERAKVYREALVAYSKVVDNWPDALKEKARAFVETGRLHRKLKETPQALTAFEAALATPGQARAHVMALESMASLHRKQKNLKGVRETYERLIRDCAGEDRSCAKAKLSLASLARRAHQWNESDRLAKSVLDDTPQLWRENVDAGNAIVSGLIKRREWRKALDSLKAQDEFLRSRFESTETWAKVQKAMAKMSARRTLTPVTESD
ncbi:MAG: hypothetical protein V3W41_10115 [Planctomycetota bacterium]